MTIAAAAARGRCRAMCAQARRHGAAAAVLAAAALLSAGCGTGTGLGPYGDTERDVVAAVDRDATPMGFTVCHGYGCWARSAAALDANEWIAILALFHPAAPTPEAERARVAQAIGMIEKAVGPRTGTAGDRPRAPLNFGDPGQLDCVDEAINTTAYLNMLSHAGLLVWHDPGEPAQRGHFYMLNMHFTATLRERRSGAYYAVDSWFFANGAPAVVLPLDVWHAGWHPGDPVTATASR